MSDLLASPFPDPLAREFWLYRDFFFVITHWCRKNLEYLRIYIKYWRNRDQYSRINETKHQNLHYIYYIKIKTVHVIIYQNKNKNIICLKIICYIDYRQRDIVNVTLRVLKMFLVKVHGQIIKHANILINI